MTKTVDQRAAIEIKKIIAPVLQAVQQRHPEGLDKGINIFHNPVNVEIHINSNNQAEPEEIEGQEIKNQLSLPRPEMLPHLIQSFEAIGEETELTLFEIFKKLPEPRWDVLQYWIYKACANRNMTVQETATLMSMHKPTVARRYKSFGIDVKHDDPRTREDG